MCFYYYYSSFNLLTNIYSYVIGRPSTTWSLRTLNFYYRCYLFNCFFCSSTTTTTTMMSFHCRQLSEPHVRLAHKRDSDSPLTLLARNCESSVGFFISSPGYPPPPTPFARKRDFGVGYCLLSCLFITTHPACSQMRVWNGLLSSFLAMHDHRDPPCSLANASPGWVFLFFINCQRRPAPSLASLSLGFLFFFLLRVPVVPCWQVRCSGKGCKVCPDIS